MAVQPSQEPIYTDDDTMPSIVVGSGATVETWADSTTPPPQSLPSGSRSKRSHQLSHSLSWALRHGAHQLQFEMRNDGYVPVEQVLSNPHRRLRGYILEDLQVVVKNCPKKRFSMAWRPSSKYDISDDATIGSGKSPALVEPLVSPLDATETENNGMILCIRANNGHTLPGIDAELLLEKIPFQELKDLPVIVHGTYKDRWHNSIQSQGLSRMKRNHIHFACGLPEAGGVISGMRRSCNIYIYVDAKKCANDGVVFYKSQNGVLLTAGPNNQGTLPMTYVSHVTDAVGQIIYDARKESF